jgi:transposase
MSPEPFKVIGGVDTHADVHVAAVIHASTGQQIATRSFRAYPKGYEQLHRWIASFGEIEAVGVESTGSYGAGLVRLFNSVGVRVIEVDRPDRKTRRHHGKDDTVDAIAAAQAVLSGRATAVPKQRNGDVEAIRQLEILHRSAVKSRTQAINEFHGLVVTAPDDIREQLRHLATEKQLDTARRYRERDNDTTSAATCRWVLRELARRVEDLTGQIERIDQQLLPLVGRVAPALIGLFGVGPQTAANLLTTAGENSQRLHSEAAFAKLTGSCPLPASSGKTTRYRLNRGGDRQANSALFTITLVRMRHHQPTRDYVKRRTAEGKTKTEIIRCLKRFIAREVFAAITNPTRDIPTGPELRQLRTDKGLPLVVVCGPQAITTTELSRLERSLSHNTELAIRIQTWLNQQPNKAA